MDFNWIYTKKNLLRRIGQSPRRYHIHDGLRGFSCVLFIYYGRQLKHAHINIVLSVFNSHTNWGILITISHNWIYNQENDNKENTKRNLSWFTGVLQIFICNMFIDVSCECWWWIVFRVNQIYKLHIYLVVYQCQARSKAMSWEGRIMEQRELWNSVRACESTDEETIYRGR